MLLYLCAHAYECQHLLNTALCSLVRVLVCACVAYCRKSTICLHAFAPHTIRMWKGNEAGLYSGLWCFVVFRSEIVNKPLTVRMLVKQKDCVYHLKGRLVTYNKCENTLCVWLCTCVRDRWDAPVL